MVFHGTQLNKDKVSFESSCVVVNAQLNAMYDVSHRCRSTARN